MKQFTCKCLEEQFKKPDQVFVGFDPKSCAEILCAYRPNEKITLRRIRLEANFCPFCGVPLKEL